MYELHQYCLNANVIQSLWPIWELAILSLDMFLLTTIRTYHFKPKWFMIRGFLYLCFKQFIKPSKAQHLKSGLKRLQKKIRKKCNPLKISLLKITNPNIKWRVFNDWQSGYMSNRWKVNRKLSVNIISPSAVHTSYSWRAEIDPLQPKRRICQLEMRTTCEMS